MGAAGKCLVIRWRLAQTDTMAEDEKDVAVDPDDTLFEVEDLLEHRSTDGKDYYLVRWKGFEEETWEPDDNIDEELTDRKEELRRKSAAAAAEQGGSKAANNDTEDVNGKKKRKDKKKGKDRKRK